MAEYCKRYSKGLYANDVGEARVIYSRTSCGMWSCPHCAKANRRRWLKILAEGIRKIDAIRLQSWGFWTLTHDMQNASYVDQRKRLSSAWNRLIGQIKYHTSHEIFFVRVIEIGTKSTRRMHLHVLINFVPYDLRQVKQKDNRTYWYSDAWGERVQRAGFGRIQDIRDVSGTLAYKSPQIPLGSDMQTTRAVLVASYVTKYMIKLDVDTEKLYPYRTRRFNTSRNFPKLHDSAGFTRYEWRVGDRLTEKYAMNAWRSGLALFDLQKLQEINADDFDHNGDLIE